MTYYQYLLQAQEHRNDLLREAQTYRLIHQHGAEQRLKRGQTLSYLRRYVLLIFCALIVSG